MRERSFGESIDAIVPHMPATETLSSQDRALATVALFAGGVMLARAVEDRDHSLQPQLWYRDPSR